MLEDKLIIGELIKLGLSNSQAKIYLTLISRHELRIQEIVKLTGLPRSSVYGDIKRLFELGIAEEVVHDHFKVIRPYSVGAMHHGLDEDILRLQRLKNDLEKLERSLLVSEPIIDPGTTKITYYRDRSGARQLYWNTLKTSDTVYVYSDWGRGRYVGMRFYEKFVEESRERMIKEKVLINPTKANLESIKKYTFPGSTISRTRIRDIRVIDLKKVPIKGDTLIYDSTYAQVFLKGLEINGFEIKNIDFVETQRALFKTLWADAKPIKSFL